MASRGVRIAKDITAEWSRLTTGLLDRIECYEQSMDELKRKVGGEGADTVFVSAPLASSFSQAHACYLFESVLSTPVADVPQVATQQCSNCGRAAFTGNARQPAHDRHTAGSALSGALNSWQQQQQMQAHEELRMQYDRLREANADMAGELQKQRAKSQQVGEI